MARQGRYDEAKNLTDQMGNTVLQVQHAESFQACKACVVPNVLTVVVVAIWKSDFYAENTSLCECAFVFWFVTDL